ncbi:hypothetical protein Bhyg_14884 [Pseudolycoriella hygida]|uniref:Uncharacterized protein n=1 Tax=Pseudolycoriella hygida TaxID=35572 RepID=A0A9Q0RXQ1_9DIPT|nr:hypothetical protein Bhyg_14884 [Pseudolycoriella hygida]
MLKISIILLFAIVATILSVEANCKKCGTAGAFCGRGPNRVDCCNGFYCNIAPDDSSAVCTSCGTTGAFCGRGPSRVDCCPDYRCDIAPNDSYANCVPN